MSEIIQTAPSPEAAAEAETEAPRNKLTVIGTQYADERQKVATWMAKTPRESGHIPAHLYGNTYQETYANCLAVARQADVLGLDATIVAQNSYFVRGKVAYQGIVVAAAIDNNNGKRAGLIGRLRYHYNSKQGDSFAIVVYGCERELPTEAKPLIIKLAEENDRTIYSDLQDMGVLAVRLSVEQGKTQNEMWRKDPEQKLVYSGVVRWARRHRPDMMLGGIVGDKDEIEAYAETATEPLPRAILPAPKILQSTEPVVTKTDAAPEVLKPVKQARVPRPKATESDPAPPVKLVPVEDDPAPAEPVAEQQEETPAEEEAEPQDSEAQLRAKLAETDYTEAELVKLAITLPFSPRVETTAKTLADIPDKQRQELVDDWGSAVEMMAEIRKAKGGK